MMAVHVGRTPNIKIIMQNYTLYWEILPYSWRVDVEKSYPYENVIHDGLTFEILAMMNKPHGRRKHIILKREHLEGIYDEARYCLFFRHDLKWRGFYPAKRDRLEHAIERIPSLLEIQTNRYWVTI